MSSETFSPFKVTLTTSAQSFGSLLLDDDTKHAEQNVVGPSFALADVHCPFKTGLREAR